MRRSRANLAEKPVWLFSSGPVGTEPIDAEGRDQKEAAIPKGMPELCEAVHARDHHVFFGANQRDRKPKGFAERFLSLMPAAKEGLPEGDFRDWPEIEAWAAGIARELQPVATGSSSTTSRQVSRPRPFSMTIWRSWTRPVAKPASLRAR